MKKLLAIVALSTVLAGPALAQHDPDAHHRVRAPDKHRSSTLPPYAPDIYYEHSQRLNNNLNPDFQLGGER
jgi:hypothetical protein